MEAEWEKEEFERLYEEELAIMREQAEMYIEEEGPPAACKSLQFASPLLPAGARTSNKRPLEESPLPFISSHSDTTPSPKRRPIQSSCSSPTTPVTCRTSSLRPTSHHQHLPTFSNADSIAMNDLTVPTNGSTCGIKAMSQEPCDAPTPSLSRGRSFKSPGDPLQTYAESQGCTTSLEVEGDFAGMGQYSPSPVTSNKSSSSAQTCSSLPTETRLIGGQQRKKVRALRRAPAGPSISITDSEGKRVFLKVQSASRSEQKVKSGALAKGQLQLLSVPFSHLREAVEREQYEQLMQESEEITEALKSRAPEDESQPLFDSEDMRVLTEPPSVEKEDATMNAHLWVEKYTPRHFTELLSDDGINRTLLSWLKLWDETVFNCSTISHQLSTPHSKQKNMAQKKKTGQTKQHSTKKTARQKQAEMQDPRAFATEEALDELRRPKLKVALLCGSPGLGKTTLAHVIATHAGYSVVEMNASDDRSPEVFYNMLQSATQMQAVLTDSSKPNCLIIDEIDGAPTAAINVLIDVIKKKDAGTKKKSKKGGSMVLSRPIICICNDQYAPSLRQLRPHTLLLTFPTTTTARLASRLLEVARKEKMGASTSVLMALCEKTDNDIRACLNTLQFINRYRKDLSLATVQNAAIGQKDAQRNLFSLWKEIFQLPTSKKHTLNKGPLKLSRTLDGFPTTYVSIAGSEEMAQLSINAARFFHILALSAASGEHEKVAQGLFENYLNIKFRDPNMESIATSQEWLVFHDQLLERVNSMQQFQLLSYLSYIPVKFHFLFASSSIPRISYPYSHFESVQTSQRLQQLLANLAGGAPPFAKQTMDAVSLPTLTLPYLLEIISPSLRPVNTQLYSPREKQQLSDLVSTMISYNLSYYQERTPDGQYTYVLEPNVEEICRFSGLPQRKQLPYSTKQLLAHEIEVEKMRRAEQSIVKGSSGSEQGECTPKHSKKTSTNIVTKPTPRAKGTAIVTKIKEDKPVLDFFGRPISKDQNEAEHPARGRGSSYLHNRERSFSHPLWFRFNEGFSNAVRRPVRIQDLL